MRIIVLTVNIFFALYAFSQTPNNTGVWLNAEQSYRIHQDWELGSEQAFRSQNTFAQQSFIGISATYRALDFLRPKLGYRWVGRPHPFNTNTTDHRIQLDLSHKRRFADFDIKFRNRYQIRYQNFGRSEKGKNPDIYSRFKLDLSYPLNKKWEVGIGNEYWLRLSGNEGYFFDRIRWSISLEREINKESKIAFSYFLQKEIQVAMPSNLNVLSLEYSYSFDFRKPENDEMPIKWYRLPTD